MLCALRLRWKALWNRRRLERDLEDELQFHLAMRAEHPEAARRQFGSVAGIQESCRAVWTFAPLENFARDVRHAARLLAKNPGYAAAAVLSLTLGIGACTAVFSVISTVFLRPLPWRDAGRIVRMSLRNEKLSAPSDRETFDTWRRNTKLFSEVAAVNLNPAGLSLTGLGDAEHHEGSLVSSNFFALLGAAPALGRTFFNEEDQTGRANVAVLSDAFWRRRFHADPRTVGRSLMLNGQACTVIGVMPAGFKVPQWYLAKEPDIWLPQDRSKDLGGNFLGVLGRVKPGVSLRQAEAEATALLGRGWRAGRFRCAAAPLTSDYDSSRPKMTLLFGVVGLVLLVACANVANITLARATARTREMGIRAAIGAGRARLALQLLIEHALIAALSGVAALLFAQGAIALVRYNKTALLPRVDELSLDWNVFAFAAALSIAACFAAGFLPALRAARPGITQMLGAASERSGDGRLATGAREALIVLQVTLSVMLLAGAGLLGRSLLALSRVDLGFDPQHALIFNVKVPEQWSEQHVSGYFSEMRRRIAAVPGVDSAAYTDFGAPLEGTASFELIAAGSRTSPDTPVITMIRRTSPGYFRALGIPLLSGRDYTDLDLQSDHGEVVVNEALVRMHWPGENGIGRLIYPPGGEKNPLRISGVFKDVREYDRTAQPQQEICLPSPGTTMVTLFAVRTSGDPMPLVPAIRRAAAAVNPQIAMYQVRRLEDVVSADIAPQKFLAGFLAAFAAVGAFLAAIGLYGVVSYAANRRAREIAIRLALGAGRGSILRAIGGRYLTASAAGVIGGLVGSTLAAGLIRRFLFGIEPEDPTTLAGVAVMLVAVATIAAWLPVRRTLHADPMRSLQYE
jgi:putative ABC transport system permease protein